MASFAKLNSQNIVIVVESVVNDVIIDSNGVEQEQIGIEFLRNLYKEPDANWKQTSYNTNGGVHSSGGIPFRKNHAGIGYTYSPQLDAFIPPQIYNSLVLNENTCLWEAPVAKPELTQEQIDNKNYYNWNEQTLTWDLLQV
jgi:hypothetical protein